MSGAINVAYLAVPLNVPNLCMYPTNMLSEAAQLLDPSISLVAVDLIMVQRLGKDRREMNLGVHSNPSETTFIGSH